MSGQIAQEILPKIGAADLVLGAAHLQQVEQHQDRDQHGEQQPEVRQEIAQARRFCVEHGWPLIDVTRRSIEETAATIMNYYAKHTGAEA
jgi:regulator of PEP synthase PpsR (kinase-PPPase family)